MAGTTPAGSPGGGSSPGATAARLRPGPGAAPPPTAGAEPGLLRAPSLGGALPARGLGGCSREADDALAADCHDGFMPEIQNAGSAAPMPLLFLISDTGGGHRNAARAVGQALGPIYPGRFAPVLCEPLSRPGPAPLRRTLLRLADRPAADAARAQRPAAIVSFHPLTGMAAVAARDRSVPGTPVVTVVTDLARTHAAWRYADVDLIIAPHAAVPDPGRPPRPAQHGWATAGLPVTREVWGRPPPPRERAILRRSLGLSENEFLVLLPGGGEGSGGLARRPSAILPLFPPLPLPPLSVRTSPPHRTLPPPARAA